MATATRTGDLPTSSATVTPVALAVPPTGTPHRQQLSGGAHGLRRAGECPPADGGRPWVGSETAERHHHAESERTRLAAPVHRGGTARQAPLQYLSRISEFYQHRLRADPGFTGVLTLNPIWAGPEFKTHWLRRAPYELAELAEAIPPGWRRPRVATSAVGRNVRPVPMGGQRSSPAAIGAADQGRGRQGSPRVDRYRGSPRRHMGSERARITLVRHIARHAAGYSRRQYSEGHSGVQQNRGQRSGKARRKFEPGATGPSWHRATGIEPTRDRVPARGGAWDSTAWLRERCITNHNQASMAGRPGWRRPVGRCLCQRGGGIPSPRTQSGSVPKRGREVSHARRPRWESHPPGRDPDPLRVRDPGTPQGRGPHLGKPDLRPWEPSDAAPRLASETPRPGGRTR